MSVMKPAMLMAVVLVVFGQAASAAERMDPVPAAKPVADDIKKLFDDFFGADLKVALASPEPADDAALAEKILEEAKKRAGYPGFQAYALDQVVWLASGTPGKMRLAYEALNLQRRQALRPARPCLEKMMLVAPRVATEMTGSELDYWITTFWMKDAMDLAGQQVAENKLSQAYTTLAALQEPIKQSTAPQSPEYLEAFRSLDFLQELEAASLKYEAELRTSGLHPQAGIAMAALRIGRDNKPREAIAYLKSAGDPAATELATTLEVATKGTATSKDQLALAQALAAVAPKATGAYFQYLLWAEADRRASRALAANLQETDKLRIEMLKEKTTAKVAELSAEFPPMVMQMVSGQKLVLVPGAPAATAATAATATTPSPVPAGPAPPAPPDGPGAAAVAPSATPVEGPMPQSEQDKIARLMDYLYKNISCISCHGTGLISGDRCTDCAGTVSYEVNVRQRRQRTYAPYEWYYITVRETRTKGNGKTPVEKLRPSVLQIVALCRQYENRIPSGLLAKARATCSQIDPESWGSAFR